MVECNEKEIVHTYVIGHTALLVNPEPLNPSLTKLFTLIILTYGEM